MARHSRTVVSLTDLPAIAPNQVTWLPHGRRMQDARGKSRLSYFLPLASCALLQENRHRPIVVNLDEHVRAKDAGLHRDACGFQQFDQAADEWLGHIGRRASV